MMLVMVMTVLVDNEAGGNHDNEASKEENNYNDETYKANCHIETTVSITT